MQSLLGKVFSKTIQRLGGLIVPYSNANKNYELPNFRPLVVVTSCDEKLKPPTIIDGYVYLSAGGSNVIKWKPGDHRNLTLVDELCRDNAPDEIRRLYKAPYQLRILKNSAGIEKDIALAKQVWKEYWEARA